MKHSPFLSYHLRRGYRHGKGAFNGSRHLQLLRISRLDISVWSDKVDGYICQSKDTSDPYSPSEILSRYFNKDVHLIYKGPRPRPCEPTIDFPKLDASAVFQDGYPLLLASEESLKAIQEQIKGQIGVQGVDEHWARDELEMTRYVPL